MNALILAAMVATHPFPQAEIDTVCLDHGMGLCQSGKYDQKPMGNKMKRMSLGELMDYLNGVTPTPDTIGYWLKRYTINGGYGSCALAYCPLVEIIDTVWVLRKK